MWDAAHLKDVAMRSTLRVMAGHAHGNLVRRVHILLSAAASIWSGRK